MKHKGEVEITEPTFDKFVEPEEFMQPSPPSDDNPFGEEDSDTDQEFKDKEENKYINK